MPTHKFADQFQSFLNKLNTLLRLLLKLSITCMLISCIIIVFFEQYLTLEHEPLSSFIWISIIGSIWAGILSITTILCTAILIKLDKRPIWPNIKRESILLIVLISSIFIFYFCGTVMIAV